MTLCASANAATVHHSRPRHQVVAGPGQDLHAISRGAYLAVGPTIKYGTPRYDDPSRFAGDYGTPRYDDPSKSGGSEALPIQY